MLTSAPTVVKEVRPPPVLDPESAGIATAHVWWNNLVLALPRIGAALLFLLAAWIAARLIARLVRTTMHRRQRLDLGGVLASLTFGGLMIAGVLVAAVIAFPSVQPATIISSLGIGTVAIGFAFKDILQNLLAGILLLINRPFRRGDQIVVKDYEGTVEHIQSRATLIKTYDGRRVIIPNADIYTSPVTVNTAFPTRRSQFDVGIGYGDDIAEACRVFTAAAAGIEGVAADPAPETLPWGLDDTYVTLRVRWWTSSKRTDVVHIQARVIAAIAAAAKEHAIDLPFPTQVMLFHDQTEEVDGDRAQQREGWPAGKSPPRSRRLAQRDDQRSG